MDWRVVTSYRVIVLPLHCRLYFCFLSSLLVTSRNCGDSEYQTTSGYVKIMKRRVSMIANVSCFLKRICLGKMLSLINNLHKVNLSEEEPSHYLINYLCLLHSQTVIRHQITFKSIQNLQRGPGEPYDELFTNPIFET